MEHLRKAHNGRPWYLYLFAAAAVLIVILGVDQLGTSKSSARTEKETETAAYGVVQSTISGSGSVEPGVEEDVNFGTSGTLKAVYVKVGQTVKKGQLLAELDPTSAKLTLAEAKLALSEAQTALTDAEDGDSDSSDSSSSSSSGNSGNSSSGTSENATLKTADTARAEFVDDVETTTTGTGTSTSGTDTSTTTGSTTTTPKQPTGTTKKSTSGSGSKSTTSSSKRSGSNTSSAAKSSNSSSSSNSNSSSSSGSSDTSTGTTTTTTVSATEVAADKLQVAEDKQTVATDAAAVVATKLYAPVAGEIATLSSSSPGESVSSGTNSNAASSSSSSSSSSNSSSSEGGSSGGSSSSAFAEIVNSKLMSMTVTLSEANISSLKVGQVATVDISALTGVELAGKVTEISPLGTTSDDVVEYDATITIYQHNSQVLPGMSATATIITDQASGVTVPTEALSGSGSTATVNLVGSDGKVTEQQVIVALRGSSRAVIASGLKAGQEVQITETLPSLGTSTTSTSSSSSSSGSSRSGFGGSGFSRSSGGFGGSSSGGMPSGGGGAP